MLPEDDDPSAGAKPVIPPKVEKQSSRYTAICGVAGVIIGYFVSVGIAVAMYPDSPQGPILFLFTLFPIIVIVFFLIGHAIDRRAGRERD
jgi:hypothetical protein